MSLWYWLAFILAIIIAGLGVVGFIFFNSSLWSNVVNGTLIAAGVLAMLLIFLPRRTVIVA